ncbi:hypothetical protein F5X68DRAFT_263813 [Plectosphaerella plurivora]|uniref:Prolyl 4-hydroxylase alpha subunit Fe(2+) 2OG dioxygenase domain-containing protein n=1 Tax=Plectosphaerella plurivora TaxID=936078 RepID=A0A9P9A807_9PEZI|nr:hypothetical protein F5X68DRAFT_263813 [Plectosphaerella plurivora]
MPSLEQDSVFAGYNPVGVLGGWYNNEEEESEEEDNEETWAKFQIGLHTLLDSITSGGEISSEQHYPLSINPGLKILDKLPISLPLRPSDAESIRDTCRQAPFGRGNDTVVDTSVRKTWELDHTQFHHCNPALDAFLKDTLLKKAADDLGLESVRAEPYKLLLYEAGSFFKPLKDSEKTPGMVATLVICLPSEHQGGDVHLSFGGMTRVLSSGSGSKFDMTALAWYGDVTHEVKDLTSGHRLVITYNVILDSPSSEDSVLFLEQAVTLRKMLEDWRWRFSDFIYKAAEIPPCSKVLQSVASDAGFYIFAGHMTYSIEEEDWNERNETEPVLADIFAPDGTAMATSGTTSMQELLDEAQYQGRAPDYTKRGEFTGNASMPDTLRYHDTVIILTPKEQIMDVVGEHHVGTALSVVLADLERRPNDKIVKDAIQGVIESGMEGPHKPQRRDYAKFTEWAVRLNLMRLYEQVTSLYSDYPEIVPAMAKALEWKSQQLAWSDAAKASYSGWDAWFIGVLRATSDVHDLRKALSVFKTTLSDPYVAKSFSNWAKTAAALSLGHRNRWLGLDLEMVQEVILEMHEHGGPDRMTSWGAQLPLYPFDQGWKSPPKGCRNDSCKNCRDLDTFLESPTRTTWSLQGPWAARKYIESQLGTSDTFTVETERTRPSDTLAITKKITFFSQELAACRKAFSDLEADFEFLKTDYIRQFLGDIEYRQLVTISDPANRVYAKPFVFTPPDGGRSVTLILPSTTADSLSADGPLQPLEPDIASSHATSSSGGIEPEGNTVDPTTQPTLGEPVARTGQKRPSDDAQEQYDGREKRMAIVIDD